MSVLIKICRFFMFAEKKPKTLRTRMASALFHCSPFKGHSGEKKGPSSDMSYDSDNAYFLNRKSPFRRFAVSFKELF